MKCSEVDTMLEALVAAELEPGMLAGAESHLAECGACAAGLAQARKLVAILAKARPPAMPEGFFERQRAAIFARLATELEWQAPKLSLVTLAMVLGGYVFVSMPSLMDSALDVARHSGSALAGLGGVLPLYGILLGLAVFTFNRSEESGAPLAEAGQ